MKAKLSLILTIGILMAAMLLAVGCGTKEESSSVQSNEISQQEKAENEYYELNKVVNPVKDIAFTVSAIEEKGSVKGEGVKNELSAGKGYYVADLKNVVPTNDYKIFIASVSIKNNTDKALGLSELGWSAKLLDGSKIGTISVDSGLNGDVASHNSINGQIKILINSTLSNEFLLTYDYLDYNDEWAKAMQKAIKGEMTEKEFKDKFKTIPMTWKLNSK